jgi:DNA-binding transcriptional regulator YbjK
LAYCIAEARYPNHQSNGALARFSPTIYLVQRLPLYGTMYYIRKRDDLVTNNEIQRNKRAFDHAIAQQRLEGLVVPPETVAALERVTRGEITTSDVISNLYDRYAHVEVLKL